MSKTSWKELGSGKDKKSSVTDMAMLSGTGFDCYVQLDSSGKWAYEVQFSHPTGQMSSVYGHAESLDIAKKKANKVVKFLTDLE